MHPDVFQDCFQDDHRGGVTESTTNIHNHDNPYTFRTRAGLQDGLQYGSTMAFNVASTIAPRWHHRG